MAQELGVDGADRIEDTKVILNWDQLIDRLDDEALIREVVPLLDTVKTELKRVITFLSRTDWIDVAKREKVITDDTLNADMACR